MSTSESVSAWPTKMTHEEKRVVKQREKDFQAALKANSRAAGWRYAASDIFRQQGEWFVSILPSLTWQRGVRMQLMVKPMALDSLFWDIVGVEENSSLPLSFRARGAWVLRPVTFLGPILLDIEEPDVLARRLLEWANEHVSQSLQTASVQQMLDDLPDPSDPRCSRALGVCLNILNDDLDRAMRICQIEGGHG